MSIFLEAQFQGVKEGKNEKGRGKRRVTGGEGEEGIGAQERGHVGTKSRGGRKGGREDSAVEGVHRGGGRGRPRGRGRGGRGHGGRGQGGRGKEREGKEKVGKGRGEKGIEVREREEARGEREGRGEEDREETDEKNRAEKEDPGVVVDGRSAAGVKRKARRGGGKRNPAPKRTNTSQTSIANAKRVEYIRVR